MSVTSAAARPTSLARRLHLPRADYSGYLFIAPATVLTIVFSFISMAISLWMSFHKWDVLNPVHPWLGFKNYWYALTQDGDFWLSMRNTLYYTAVIVPALTVFGLLLAFIANEVRRGRSFFRSIYYIPALTPTVALALVWTWLLRSDGALNSVLSAIGIQGPNWLMDPNWSMPAVLVYSIWAGVGGAMVIFMAGLNDIPADFYEAAQLDGANRRQMFWHVTVPLLRNPLIFVTVTNSLLAWQVFTQMYILENTTGGPANSTLTIAMKIYQEGFLNYKMGYAAAMSWLLFLVIFVIGAIQLRVYRSQQVY
jgi:multiple sugar transport system permease protein